MSSLLLGIKDAYDGDIQHSERYIDFLTRTVPTSNGLNWIDIDQKLSIKETDEIINIVLNKLNDSRSSSQNVIRLQLDTTDILISNYDELQNILKTRYQLITSTANNIAHNSTHISEEASNITSIYAKIQDFIHLYNMNMNTSKIDSLSNETIKEINAAFESVFSKSGVYSYIQLTMKQKIDQLLELAKIVLGIRLFNHIEGKGGDDIPDLYSTVHKEYTTTYTHYIQHDIQYMESTTKKEEKIILKAFLLKRRQEMMNEVEQKRLQGIKDHSMSDDIVEEEEEKERDPLDNEAPLGADGYPLSGEKYAQIAMMDVTEMNRLITTLVEDSEKLNTWISQLAYSHQFTVFLMKLNTQFTTCMEHITRIYNHIVTESHELHNIVGSKIAVSKDIVYPKFTLLGQLWMELVDETYYYETIKKSYMYYIDTYRSNFIPISLNAIPKIMKDYSDTHDDKSTNQHDHTFNSDDKQSSNQPLHIRNNSVHTTMLIAESKNSSNSGDDIINDRSQVKHTYKDIEYTDKDINSHNVEGNQILTIGGHHQHRESFPINITARLSNADISAEAKVLTPSTTTTAESLTRHEADKIYHSDCHLLYIHNHPQLLSTIHLALNGYCIWTITDKQGLLVHGNTDFGIIKYKSHYYICESKSGVQTFVTSPDTYLQKLHQFILYHPEYLYLLEAKSLFPKEYSHLFPNDEILNSTNLNINPHKRLGGGSGNKVIQCDASTETPTHFIEKYIDPTYQWNEWEMRRQILKYVHLQTCKTSSTQTINSHYRRENYSQVYLPKNNETQTRIDKGTNPNLVTTYIAGINGHPDPTISGQVSRYIKSTSSQEFESKKKGDKVKSEQLQNQIRVVKLTLDI